MKTEAATARLPSASALKGIKPWLPTLALALAPAWAAAQPTTPLNDTGQTQCFNGSAMVACDEDTTGNDSTYPGQDGRYGRDAAQGKGTLLLPKTGGGVAGFDFTKVCNSGQLAGQGACPAAPASVNPSNPGANEWACTKDNVTGLLWSIETLGSMNWTTAITTYPSDGSSSHSRCGYTTGWRLPTPGELESLVNYGPRSGGCVGGSQCAIDTDYFPNTQADGYWTSKPYAPDPTVAWVVYFGSGYSGFVARGSPFYVRLVRSGQ